MKWATVIIFPVLLSTPCSSAPHSVTNEDIKDAIMSMVQMFRSLTDKLERHELRERQLGDQLKKALSALDRRGRSQSEELLNIKTSLHKFEEKFQKMESSMSVNERDKGVYMIDTLMTNMEGMLQKSNFTESSLNHLNDLETLVSSHFNTMSKNIDRLENRLIQLMPETNSKTDVATFKRVESQMDSLQKWQNEILTTLGSHDNYVKELIMTLREEGRYKLEILKTIINQTDLSPVLQKLEWVHNHSQTILHQTQEIFEKLSTNLNNQVAVGLYDYIEKRFDQVSSEMKNLGKVESVLLQTSDNVIDTKRRIEYAVQQILLEIGDLVKFQGKDMNITMNKRINEISETILENQKGGMTNLSSKIEAEISQVWRQIGIMYQQLTTSAGVLDVLKEQTETYINGSLQTMGSMEGKVGQITSRMEEIDENLNYLLGRFSLVTREFNQIKSGLANALDNVKNTFKSVQQKIEEVGPGPNPIPSSPEEEDNTLGSL